MKILITFLAFIMYSSVLSASGDMSSHRYNEIQNFLNKYSDFQSFIYRYGMDSVINAYEDSNVEYCSRYKRKRIVIRCIKDQMYDFLEMNIVQPEHALTSEEFENVMIKVRNSWQDIIKVEGKIEFDNTIKTYVLPKCDLNSMNTNYKNQDLSYCLISETFSYYKHNKSAVFYKSSR